ncbi:unnamed protein product, partial [marine sediment metagenome]
GRGSQTIAEKMPIPEDAKSELQLQWRHMYQKAVALWHALSPEEKQEWESNARSRHMTGFAWFMSQCLKPNPGIYLPLQGGQMQGNIDMAKHKILKLPTPEADQEAATKSYVDEAVPPPTSLASGSYTGDNTVNRAIAHGLGRIPHLVVIFRRYSDTIAQLFNIIKGMAFIASLIGDRYYAVTAVDATNFYVGNATDYEHTANKSGSDYKWIAI